MKPTPTTNDQQLTEMGYAILNSLTEQVAVLDQEGFIVYVNTAWKTFADQNGYGGGNYFVGNNYLSVCGAEIEQDIRAVLKGEKPSFELEYPCHTPTQKRWYMLYVTPLVFSSGAITGVTTSHVNITERKLAETEVKKLQEQLLNTERQRVMTETAGAAAHEINQPLMAITLSAEILLRQKNVSDKMRDDLERLLKAGHRIRDIVVKMNQAKQYATKDYLGEKKIIDFDAASK